MTCELAGSYDLLVPLMFAEGIAFVALRRTSLYHAQVQTKRDSPAHRDDLITDVLQEILVGSVATKDRPFTTFERRTPANEVMKKSPNRNGKTRFRFWRPTEHWSASSAAKFCAH